MARKFNAADHPRDRFGRFTKSRTVKASAKDKVAAKAALEGLSPKQTSDRQAYLQQVAGQTSTVGDIAGVNKALRAGKGSPEADDLDAAMVLLPDDVLLSRRVPLSAFGSTDPASLAGMKVRDAGFAPTQLGTLTGGEGQVRMRIAAPAGTRAAVNPETGEVILDRDTEMVVARVEKTPDGGHDMYLTVLPKQGARQDPQTPDGDGGIRADLMKLKVPELRERMRERGLKPGRMRKTQMVDALVGDETGPDEPSDRAQPATAPSGTAPAAGDAALAAAPQGLRRPDSGLSGSAKAGLTAYQDGTAGSDYRAINGALRTGGTGNEGVTRSVAGIDEAMTVSPLTSDVTVYRGVRDGRSMFGDRLDAELTGMVWREDAYVSTSTDEVVAGVFSNSGGVRMRITAPQGVGAVDLSDHDDPSEQELLLDRGHEFTVTADRGVVDGVRHLDVTMRPKTTPEPTGGVREVASTVTTLAEARVGRDTIGAVYPAVLADQGLDGDETPQLAALTELVTGPEGQVHQAVAQTLTAKGALVGGVVSVADVRSRLIDAGMTDAEVDAVLIRMAIGESPQISLFPEANQKTLTAEKRAAAVRMGNQDKHLLVVLVPDLPRIAEAARLVAEGAPGG